MEDARVADIWFRDEDSFGSGYLVADCLILTAAHVAAPLCRGARCIVRPLAQPSSELPAVVEWFHPTLDIALIKLSETWPIEIKDNVKFGFIAPTGGVVPLACRASGFPEASTNDAGERDDKPFLGTLTRAVRRQQLHLHSDNGEPFEAEGWRGFSGAAVFCGDLLVGVVATVPISYRSEVLYAEPIGQCFEHEEFRLAVRPDDRPEEILQPVRPARYFEAVAKKLGSKHIFLDRRPQLDELLDRILPLKVKRPPSSSMFLITGTAQDVPRLLIERIAVDERFKEIWGDAPVTELIAQLSWPQSRTVSDPLEQFATLREEAAMALGVSGETALDTVKFRDALKERPRARGLWWSLPDQIGNGHAELLTRWLDYCAEIQTGMPPLLTFIVTPMEPIPPGLLWWRVPSICRILNREIGSLRMTHLPRLRGIERFDDLSQWIKYLQNCGELNRHDAAEVKWRIEQEIEVPALPLAQFSAAITRSLLRS